MGDCQPNSLELALADPSGQDGEFDHKTAQRYLLGKVSTSSSFGVVLSQSFA